MKYMLPYGWVRVIHGDYNISRKCYAESLKLKKVRKVGVNTVDVKLGKTPLKENPHYEGLVTRSQEDTELVERDLLSNENNY